MHLRVVQCLPIETWNKAMSIFNQIRENKYYRTFSLIYLGVWLFSVIVFWIFCKSAAALIVIIFEYLMLPALSFILSLCVGKKAGFKNYSLVAPFVFGLMQLLWKLTAITLPQVLAMGYGAKPDIKEFFMVVIISAIGLTIGCGVRYLKSKAKGSNT